MFSQDAIDLYERGPEAAEVLPSELPASQEFGALPSGSAPDCRGAESPTRACACASWVDLAKSLP